MTKDLRKKLSEYESTLRAFNEGKKMFERLKFSLDSFEKAEYAYELRELADELEELQASINEG